MRVGGYALSEEERQRYAGQLMIPGWGEAAQERLKAATVFVAGAGGLGSPVAVMLALAMDNYAARFCLNAAAIQKEIPMVHGSIWGFEGRHPPGTPCLACIVKASPPREVFPVLGATPGISGTLQAMEALKYLSEVGELLKGRLLCCDYLGMRFFEVRVRKEPHCSACGTVGARRDG